MEEVDIVIIGAGAGGLGAARYIYENNIKSNTVSQEEFIYFDNHKKTPGTIVNFLILEACGGIGGRVTEETVCNGADRDSLEKIESNRNNNKCIKIQLGANWIHGLDENRNPMCSAARRLNLPLHKTSSDDEPGDDVLLFDASNHDDGSSIYHVVPKDEYDEVIRRYDWIKDKAYDLDGNLSLQEGLDVACRLSEQKYGKLSDLQKRCLNWCFDRISISVATSLSSLSLFDFTSSESDGEDGEALVGGGYFQLIRHLFEQYPISIRYHHIVTNINSNHPSGNIHITCTNGYEVLAKRCIITVPIGVLIDQMIEFKPKVPEVIDLVTSNYSSGLMNLIWIWFPNSFWPNGYNFFGVSREDGQETGLSTFLAPPIYDNHGEKQAVLMCQVVHQLAVDIETMTDDEVSIIVMRTIKRMFPGQDIPSPIACRHSCWLNNPFARGSWSYKNKLSTLSVEEFVMANANSIATSGIGYAGEAVGIEYKETVHGAYLSGRETAIQVLASLEKE